MQKTKPKSSIILWEKQTGYLKTILQTNIVTLASEIMMQCEHASDKAHIDVIVKLDGSTRLIPTVAHCMYASK